jgi:hypothetical protein
MELIPGYAPQGLTGTYFGVYYLLSGVVAAIGTSAVGLVADLAGDGAAWASWACCALLGFASALAVNAMRGSRSLEAAAGPQRTVGAAGAEPAAAEAKRMAPHGTDSPARMTADAASPEAAPCDSPSKAAAPGTLPPPATVPHPEPAGTPGSPEGDTPLPTAPHADSVPADAQRRANLLHRNR